MRSELSAILRKVTPFDITINLLDDGIVPVAPHLEYFAMKMNNLVDEEVIDALYEASATGCDVDLVIRGICRLRPGVPGRSERIRVRSIVGRFLEHSRIFAFGRRDGATRYFIGSADLTPSNLDRRVQLLCPVGDAALTARLEQILSAEPAPTTSAWSLGPAGSWSRIDG
jgi:polyphosphate kinase